MSTVLRRCAPQLRSALVAKRSTNVPPAMTRNFASSAHHDEQYEARKWERITYLGIATCFILAIYNLSKGHHFEEPPVQYPYMRIRNKDFPWGSDSLFETIKKRE